MEDSQRPQKVLPTDPSIFLNLMSGIGKRMLRNVHLIWLAPISQPINSIESREFTSVILPGMFSNRDNVYCRGGGLLYTNSFDAAGDEEIACLSSAVVELAALCRGIEAGGVSAGTVR